MQAYRVAVKYCFKLLIFYIYLKLNVFWSV